MNQVQRFVRYGLCLIGWLAGTGWTAAQDYVVPISGISPLAVVSLTDERDTDDSSFFAANSDYNDTSISSKTSPIRVLPVNGAPHYDIFIYDTGSPAHIMGYGTTTDFAIADAGRRGTNFTPVGGAGGEFLEASNSDPIALYAAGFGAIRNAESMSVDTTQFRGQYNVSVLNGEFDFENPDVELPNLIGTPLASQYTTVIENSKPQLHVIDDTLRRSPDMQLRDIGDIERPRRRIGMRFESGGNTPAPAFIPDLGGLNINDLGDNPSIPTNTGWFFVDANMRNGDAPAVLNQEMLFDTGAQATIVSEQTAVRLGFDVELDEPDFVVRIQGVTGTSEEVPGFIAEEFSLPGTFGGLTLTNVPLVVFDLTDPRDAFATLPGLLGMNVFADRDVIINPEGGNAFLGVSDPVVESRSWGSPLAEAAWETAESWNQPGTPDIDWYAYLINTTGTPQTATLSTDTTISSLITQGHDSVAEGTMRVSVRDATLTLYGSAILQGGSTLELQQANLDALAVELRDGAISGNGEVRGEVLSQGILQPGGIGTVGRLVFPGSLDQLSRGTLEIDLTSGESFDQIHVEGSMTLGGHLAIAATDDYIDPLPGTQQRMRFLEVDGRLFGDFDSYSYAGQTIGQNCAFDDAAECRALTSQNFRQHVGGGKFIEVLYGSSDVSVLDYQALPGDTNGDRSVNFDDFLVLSDNFGEEGDWRAGDFSGNGVVDFADFLGLSNTFGAAAPASVVPEPQGILMAFTVALGWLGCRNRRRFREASAESTRQ